MFDARYLTWVDFEVASLRDLQAAGTVAYSADTSTRAIVLAYAIGDGPVLTWHADGAILDWDSAPDDLRDAVARGATIAAWNASFDSAIYVPFVQRAAALAAEDAVAINRRLVELTDGAVSTVGPAADLSATALA